MTFSNYATIRSFNERKRTPRPELAQPRSPRDDPAPRATSASVPADERSIDGPPGTAPASPRSVVLTEVSMNAIIYLVGLVVVVLFILSLVGLR